MISIYKIMLCFITVSYVESGETELSIKSYFYVQKVTAINKYPVGLLEKYDILVCKCHCDYNIAKKLRDEAFVNFTQECADSEKNLTGFCIVTRFVENTEECQDRFTLCSLKLIPDDIYNVWDLAVWNSYFKIVTDQREYIFDWSETNFNISHRSSFYLKGNIPLFYRHFENTRNITDNWVEEKKELWNDYLFTFTYGIPDNESISQIIGCDLTNQRNKIYEKTISKKFYGNKNNFTFVKDDIHGYEIVHEIVDEIVIRNIIDKLTNLMKRINLQTSDKQNDFSAVLLKMIIIFVLILIGIFIHVVLQCYLLKQIKNILKN